MTQHSDASWCLSPSWTCCQSITFETNKFSQFSLIKYSNICIFGLWEEAGAPGILHTERFLLFLSNGAKMITVFILYILLCNTLSIV